jgi:CheY-like chemotaxis protein
VNPLVLEEAPAIRMVFQRLVMGAAKVTVAYQTQKADLPIQSEDGQRVALRIPAEDLAKWNLKNGEHVSLKLEDRGLKYEAVTAFAGGGVDNGVELAYLALPRVLRRSDGHRLAAFIPDSMPKAAFTNARGGLFDGQVKSFGLEGLELMLRDPKQNIQEVFRMGEQSLLDVRLTENLQLKAKTTVVYFGDDHVGLKLDKDNDARLVNQYQAWLQEQQRIQARKDEEGFNPEGAALAHARANQAAVLPKLRILVDKEPLLLLLSERADFAQRLSEALGRKFGLAHLDYVKGPLKPQLSDLGQEENWGRARILLLHNQMRLTSPLELCRQLVEKEKCPLPILLLGGEEDADKKRVRAIEAGAVDYLVVEPFKVLQVLKKIDETVALTQ